MWPGPQWAEPKWVRPSWASLGLISLALMGWAPMGPIGAPWDLLGQALMGPALKGRTRMAPWALVGRALMGWALMGRKRSPASPGYLPHKRDTSQRTYNPAWRHMYLYIYTYIQVFP